MQTIDRQTKSGFAAACCARLKSVAKPAVTAGFMLAIVGCHSAVRTSITEISGNGQRLYLEARELYAKSRAADEQGILTRSHVRRFLRAFVEAQHPEIAVICYEELPPQMIIRAVGRIGMETPVSQPA